MEDARKKLDDLIVGLRKANETWQNQMISAGYPPEEARYWAHCIDEVYDEVERLVLIIIKLYLNINSQDAPDYLNSGIADVIENLIAPEILDYMSDLKSATKNFIEDNEEGI